MHKRESQSVFISWTRGVPRSRNLALALGARNVYIGPPRGVPHFLLPLRYLVQSLRTLAVAWRDRPRVLFAMNPPIVLPLVAYAFARSTRTGLVIDSHTGAFTGRWARFLFLHRFLSRRALATLVTNEPLRAQVASWGATALVLEDRLPDLPLEAPAVRNERFSVAVISSFAPDEPTEAVLAAAEGVPGCRFFITGRVPPSMTQLIKRASTNVTFTGYLAEREYIALLNHVDAVVVLTSRDLTMTCGAYEAVAVEKPLILSDWPVLRSYFNRGTLYVDNSADSIQMALRKVMERGEELGREMRELKSVLKEHWKGRFAALSEHIGGVVESSPVALVAQPQPQDAGSGVS